tara:strand:+ start:69 stop:269 length:201 start_codon:yes stop_codon:yes gene_type:complete
LASQNPYTEAIGNIADQYKALLKDAPKKKVPKIMSEKKQGAIMPKLRERQAMRGITSPPEGGISFV